MTGLPLIKQGKVRDVYDAGAGRLVLDSTDRISAFDIVLADTIPRKGEILNAISACHLKMADNSGIPTHYISMVPAKRTAMFVYRLDMIPVEVIVRARLYGSAWQRYREGSFALPNGTEPRKGAQFPQPMVEFTTKLEASDRPVTRDEILRNGWMTADEISYVIGTALDVHRLVSVNAAKGKIIVADQKFEFGRNPELAGVPVLGDEAGTPDSSRFWDEELYAENYAAGRDQPSFDKQYVRDFLLRERGWDKERPKAGTRLTEPILTPEVVSQTTERYMEARRRIMASAGDSK
ncbi:MAG: phosphoribosylaminoimidazolesuccinocarboxamide synthase [Candidatus Aenigmarchaeota archaeon]|nr:phosphoribosylaminoimidazolesuccinocarboxamide synthase [Candidatus Aenigmarchaeota archaeon]